MKIVHTCARRYAAVRNAARWGWGQGMCGLLLLSALLSLGQAASHAAAETPSDLTQLGLEELMNIEVTSAAKKTQKLSDVAAAIFVITREDIRRRVFHRC